MHYGEEGHALRKDSWSCSRSLQLAGVLQNGGSVAILEKERFLFGMAFSIGAEKDILLARKGAFADGAVEKVFAAFGAGEDACALGVFPGRAVIFKKEDVL